MEIEENQEIMEEEAIAEGKEAEEALEKLSKEEDTQASKEQVSEEEFEGVDREEDIPKGKEKQYGL